MAETAKRRHSMMRASQRPSPASPPAQGLASAQTAAHGSPAGSSAAGGGGRAAAQPPVKSQAAAAAAAPAAGVATPPGAQQQQPAAEPAAAAAETHPTFDSLLPLLTSQHRTASTSSNGASDALMDLFDVYQRHGSGSFMPLTRDSTNLSGALMRLTSGLGSGGLLGARSPEALHVLARLESLTSQGAGSGADSSPNLAALLSSPLTDRTTSIDWMAWPPPFTATQPPANNNSTQPGPLQTRAQPPAPAPATAASTLEQAFSIDQWLAGSGGGGTPHPTTNITGMPAAAAGGGTHPPLPVGPPPPALPQPPPLLLQGAGSHGGQMPHQHLQLHELHIGGEPLFHNPFSQPPGPAAMPTAAHRLPAPILPQLPQRLPPSAAAAAAASLPTGLAMRPPAGSITGAVAQHLMTGGVAWGAAAAAAAAAAPASLMPPAAALHLSHAETKKAAARAARQYRKQRLQYQKAQRVLAAAPGAPQQQQHNTAARANPNHTARLQAKRSSRREKQELQRAIEADLAAAAGALQGPPAGRLNPPAGWPPGPAMQAPGAHGSMLSYTHSQMPPSLMMPFPAAAPVMMPGPALQQKQKQQQQQQMSAAALAGPAAGSLPSVSSDTGSSSGSEGSDDEGTDTMMVMRPHPLAAAAATAAAAIGGAGMAFAGARQPVARRDTAQSSDTIGWGPQLSMWGLRGAPTAPAVPVSGAAGAAAAAQQHGSLMRQQSQVAGSPAAGLARQGSLASDRPRRRIKMSAVALEAAAAAAAASTDSDSLSEGGAPQAPTQQQLRARGRKQQGGGSGSKKAGAAGGGGATKPKPAARKRGRTASKARRSSTGSSSESEFDSEAASDDDDDASSGSDSEFSESAAAAAQRRSKRQKTSSARQRLAAAGAASAGKPKSGKGSRGGAGAAAGAGVDTRPVYLDTRSKYRGVTRHRRSGRWEAHLWIKELGRQVYLGGYEDEDAAAEAYDMASLRSKGEGAPTNFPPERYAVVLSNMGNVTIEAFVMAVRRQSQGFSRGSSTYRGVTAHPSGRWESRIGIPGSKHVYLGLFQEEAAAAQAYDGALVRLKGAAAATNFAVALYKHDLAQHHEVKLAARDGVIEDILAEQAGPEFETFVKSGVAGIGRDVSPAAWKLAYADTNTTAEEAAAAGQGQAAAAAAAGPAGAAAAAGVRRRARLAE